MRQEAQLKARLRNIAKEKNLPAELVLRLFMMERLLERIALSDYRSRIVLKGGVLVAAIIGLDSRSTNDVDVTLKNYPLSKQYLSEMFDAILAVDLQDGLYFRLESINAIREDAEYEGYRLALAAMFGRISTVVKVDITTGDAITPEAIRFKYPCMLEPRTIDLYAYNLETLLAEKFETIVSRGLANTRMRDFYDIYLLLKFQGTSIRRDVLAKAILATVERRGTREVYLNAECIMQQIGSDVQLAQYWERYQMTYRYVQEISFEDVMSAVAALYHLVCNEQEIAGASMEHP